MAHEHEVQDLKLQVGLLKKDVDQITVLCEKLDTTIDKLQDLTSTITKMLALHEERIEKQEQSDREIVTIVEKRRTEMETNIKELHSRITTTDREQTKEMAELEARIENVIERQNDNILREIQKLQKAQQEHHETVSKRLLTVEQRQWIFMGGAAVVGYLFAHVGDILKIISG